MIALRRINWKRGQGMRVATVALLLVLSACAGSVKVNHPISRELIMDSGNGGYAGVEMNTDSMDIPWSFLNAVSRYLQQELDRRALLNRDSSLYKITVQVTKVDVNTGASRELLGAFAGPDEVESVVRVVDAKTNRVVGESVVTTRLAGLGGRDDAAWTHAEEIADFLTVE